MQNYTDKKIFHCPLPLNFDDQDLAFNPFKTIARDILIEETELEIFDNCQIANNSVVYKNFNIEKSTCIGDYNYNKYSKDYKFFLKYILPYPNFSKKNFLLITDEWTTNYYHWHIFALHRLIFLKEHNLIENTLLFLPKKYKKYSFVLDSLHKFGIKKSQLVFVPRKSNIRVKKLYFAKIFQQNPIIFNKIREIVTNQDFINKDENLNFGNKIYISREKQVLRKVENEDRILEILRSYGFVKINAEDFSYNQQISIMKNAKYLVAPHGAGLTNIIFMPKSSAILEIHNIGNRTAFNKDYYYLANMLQHRYFYQDAEFAESSKVKDAHHGNLIIDPKKLEENLKKMTS